MRRVFGAVAVVMLFYLCAKCRFSFSIRTENCPLCGGIAEPENQPVPSVAWAITVDDWHFLRTQGIDPQEEEPCFI